KFEPCFIVYSFICVGGGNFSYIWGNFVLFLLHLLPLFSIFVALVAQFFKAQPIDPELTAKLLGRGVAVSPIVTVEPRRRKFHKAITLSMPAPKAHTQGMINNYSGNAPTLRLLCSITDY
uniref:Uncharacterized protein n=1 Tax=Megaselia scalaris TaxID=36166 RepID=T1H1Y8_MEGSC